MKRPSMKKLVCGTLVTWITTTVQAQTSAPAPAPAVVPVPAPAVADAPALKIRGFVDAQYKWQKNQDVTTGVTIYDGALYVTHQSGATELFVDLPFSWTSVTVDAQSSTRNSFLVGLNKPQAWIGHTIGATKLQFGQFDTIYGLELNDSPDIVFSTQGVLFNAMLPLTHTGAMVVHALGPVTIKAMVGNTLGGAGNAGAQLKGKGEYGATVGFSNENFRAAAGYLTGRITGQNDQSRSFTDLLAGVTFGNFALDLEFALEKNGNADQGNGLLVLPVYNVTPEFALAARFEQLSKVTINGVLQDTITSITAGGQYQLSPALRIKADYTVLTLKGPDQDDNLFNLAAVYKFE